MTEFKETLLMITKSIQHFKGKCSDELNNEVDWLRNYSLYGVELWLHHAELSGFIYSKINDEGELIYFATKKGIKEYEKNFQ